MSAARHERPPPRDIARVLDRLGIEARRRGSELSARCPHREHEDKNPSWSIRDAPGTEKHGLHVCRSCGFRGTVQDLVEYLLRMSWAEARVWLDDDTATTPDVDPAPLPEEVFFQVHRASAYHLPPGFVEGPLVEWPSTIRVYAKQRGITEEQVDRWGIGFAVAGWLAGRIVIVKRDVRGLPRGYSARAFVGNPRNKYLEPLPKENADPSIVFGEQHWPPRTERAEVYLVEGALNALAIERALGIGTCVATTSGSSLHPMAAAKLGTFKEVVIVTDPDKAGDKLADQISLAMARHRAVRRVRLPEGTDANDLEQSDPEALREALRCP